MADDTGVIAKGMITNIQYLPDAVTLQVVEYDYDCCLSINAVTGRFGLECVGF